MDYELERWVLSVHPDYLVSDLGRVRNARKGTLIVPTVDPSGHLSFKTTGHVGMLVHRLVLMSFVGQPDPGKECLHIDSNPANNQLFNLRWGTRRENITDYCRVHGKHMSAHLTYADADLIRAEYDAGGHKRGTKSLLAKKWGVGRDVIYNILSGGYRRPA